MFRIHLAMYRDNNAIAMLFLRNVHARDGMFRNYEKPEKQ